MKAIIIGGGIIGLSSAYYLKKSGWDVTVIDKTDMSNTCSIGNLGMIVPSHFVPLTTPGIIAQGMKWMLNSRSPFFIKPSLNKHLINWGFQFMKSATAEKVNVAARPLLDINLYSKSLYEQLQQEESFDFSMEKKGILLYYKTEKTAAEEIHLAEKARSMGLDAAVLNRQEVQALEPGTELDVMGAVHYRNDAHLYPDQLIAGLINRLKELDVNFLPNTTVKSIKRQEKKIKGVATDAGNLEADLTVLAGGSWLRELTAMAGISTPLMPGKGYSFTARQPEKKLNIPAILCEARVAITPMHGYMRYGGTMEIAPVNNKVNRKRVEGIVNSIPKYFPGLQLSMPAEKDTWYGFRPCSPDGLPYIGRSKKFDNLIIAGGHAMMGLSLGPATGHIVADLANDARPAVDISLFNAERFSE